MKIRDLNKEVQRYIRDKSKALTILVSELRLPHRIQVNCSRDFLGSEYGGYCICPENLDKDSIVYSFGIGEDISFDLALIQRFGLSVYAFDPTPRSIEWVKSQSIPYEFHFYKYGIADYDGTAKFYPPHNFKHISHTLLYREETSRSAININVYRLETILNMLGHNRVDILKLDIEGSEFGVIEDIIDSNLNISQLLVEFHQRFEGVRLAEARSAIIKLKKSGFGIFDVRNDNYSFIKDSSYY